MKDADARVEQVLAHVVDRATDRTCPPLLARAVRYAVFPGGARIRPKLALAVAAANGDTDPALSAAGAAAIELLHCASLVHDDLPCFDNADLRRGKPSVHVAFGDRLAVLTGDALIVMAFESIGLAAADCQSPERLPDMVATLGRAVGMPFGISAGQAWECEPKIELSHYHQAKTGALFVAATSCGAAAAGVDSMAWRTLGERIGEAYQIADDIRDAVSNPETIGKPVGKDEALGRPSAVRELGLDGAIARLRGLIEDGIDTIPACPGRDLLSLLILEETKRFLPKELQRAA